MAAARRRSRNRDKIRRFILNQLGEYAEGLAQGELLARFEPLHASETWQFIDEISDMVNACLIVMYFRFPDSPPVYKQTTSSWLTWACHWQDRVSQAEAEAMVINAGE